MLEKEIASFATNAILRPGSGSDRVFEYGRSCGHAQGLQRAIALIQGILKEDEEREQNDGVLRT